MSDSMYLSIQQSAEFLGVSPRTIRSYIASGQLPASRIRGVKTVRVKKADVDALLVPIATAQESA